MQEHYRTVVGAATGQKAKRNTKGAESPHFAKPLGKCCPSLAYFFVSLIAAIYFFLIALSCSLSQMVSIVGNKSLLCFVFNLSISPSAKAEAQRTTVLLS